MAYRMHCDICDAVIPEDQEFVYLVKKSEYHSRDWRWDGKSIVGCYPCLETLLTVVPEGVVQ